MGLDVCLKGLHTQKAYTHSGTSPMQILLLLAHAYIRQNEYMHELIWCMHWLEEVPE